MAKLKYKLFPSGGVTRVELTGDFEQGSDAVLAALAAQLPSTPVVFDCAGIRRINSFGIARWTDFLGGLPATAVYEFTNCSTVLINYLNMVNAVTHGRKVTSFYIPYLCADCDRGADLLVATSSLVAGSPPPGPACPGCGAAMGPAEDLESYLGFLEISAISAYLAIV